MDEKQFGIIDLGSNSIRLVVFKIEKNGRYKEQYNMKVIARLANHINEQGEITDEGIQIVINALRHFESVIRHHHIKHINGIATAAVRQAKNQTYVLEKIHEQTPFHFRVLSGKEEARYGYLAVVNSTEIKEGITIDIGGGSTEVTYFSNRKIVHSHSFPFGALTLTRLFIKGIDPTIEEMKQLTEFLKEQFQSLPWIIGKKVPVIGIGGSARNLTKLHQEQTNYPLFGLHQYEIPPAHIKKLNDWLYSLSLEERQKLDGLSKDRADIIIPAIQAIYMLTKVTEAPIFMMSNKGLREGIFFEELLHPLDIEFFPSVTNETINQLAKSYHINTKHTSFLNDLLQQLLTELESKKIASFTKSEREILFNSTKLVQFGEYINRASSSQHTFYLLTNTSLDGINHIKRLKIACVASFKSRQTLLSYIKPYHSLLSEKEIDRLEILGAILKLVNQLNYTRRDIVSTIQMTKNKDCYVLDVFCRDDYIFEEQNAVRQKKHLEKAMNKKIIINFHLI